MWYRRPTGRLPSALVLQGSLLLPGLGHGDDLFDCMTSSMQQADDSMTIGELRLQCQKQVQSGEHTAEARPASVVSQRLRG